MSDLGKTSHKKNRFLSGIAQITSPPPSPQFGQVVPLFLDVKNNVLKKHVLQNQVTMMGVIIVIKKENIFVLGRVL